MSQRHWFFDLEETLIQSWRDPLLVHFADMRDLIERERIEVAHIFSFAIYNKADKLVFERELQPVLEAALRIKIASWVSVEELCSQSLRNTRTQWSIHEYVSVWGKVRAFEDHVLFQGLHGHAILVDDVVPDEIKINRKTGLVTEMINVESIPHWKPLPLSLDPVSSLKQSTN